MGSGVLVPAVLQTRDKYLDIRYRNANSSVGFADSEQDGLEHISTLLDEVNRGENQEGVIEAMFKSFGRALDMATSKDTRLQTVLSTKGSL